MAKGALRKRRTREHIIADLSMNHVERYVLRAGCAFQELHRDYGLDLSVTSFSAEGELEPGLVFFQVKATDHIERVRRGRFYSVVVDERDLRGWLAEDHPVILVLFDAKRERACWGHVQQHFENLLDQGGGTIQAFRTMRIPVARVLNDRSMLEILDLKRKMYSGTGE